mmetsp:Transcript_29932/g.41794  ORF Transcript_29932/g.41794 Transcript_29932/m.41794 type:complete len:85 (-) Transcript_29932:439-693(-)
MGLKASKASQQAPPTLATPEKKLPAEIDPRSPAHDRTPVAASSAGSSTANFDPRSPGPGIARSPVNSGEGAKFTFETKDTEGSS